MIDLYVFIFIFGLVVLYRGFFFIRFIEDFKLENNKGFRIRLLFDVYL